MITHYGFGDYADPEMEIRGGVTSAMLTPCANV